MLRKSHILFFICVFGFALCLTNGFANKVGGIPDGNGGFADDKFIPLEDFAFPTPDGDAYIQGTPEFQRVPERIIGTDDFEKMRDLPPNSQDYILGTRVGFLAIPQRHNPRRAWICTGFLVGPDLFMTNHHCIHDDSGLLPLENAAIFMDYYQELSVDPRRGGITARVLGVLKMDAPKDYALLRLDKDIGTTYGWLELDTTTDVDSSQSVKLISHPQGRSKEIARRNTEIVDIPAGHPLQDVPFALAYLADSQGGSSGSPVFLRDGTSVIAIHHSAWTSNEVPTFNAGSLMSYIVPEIEQYLVDSTAPDMVVQTPQVSKGWLPPGESLTLSVMVRNQGKTASSATTLRFYESFDSNITTSDIEIGTASVRSLGPFETTEVRFRLTAPASPNVYYYGACVDAVVNENITDNNCSTSTSVTVSTTPPVYMYWTDWRENKIQRAPLNGMPVEDFIVGLSAPLGIAVDVAGGHIYWTTLSTGTIQRANLDGSNSQTLVRGLRLPIGLALDIVGGHIYWTNRATGSIQRANLDGSNVETLVRGLNGPTSVALDVAGGKMYWTDWNNFTDRIQRANLDGSDVETLIPTGSGLFTPDGLSLDVANGKMYWTDSNRDSIQRANLDGTRIETLISVESPTTLALDLDAEKMYWITEGGSSIQRANLDGFNVETLVTGLESPYGIALGIPLPTTPSIPPSPTDALDVNGDGQVNVADLVIVAMFYGTRVAAGTDVPADVNSDGVVNLLDLTLVAQAIDAASGGTNSVNFADIAAALDAAAADFEAVAGAPNALSGGNLAYRNVAAALAEARLKKGVPETVLETLRQLLKEMEMAEIPESTALLPNYPNPFNPETWIPYHLATDAAVVLTIYDVRGSTVRELSLGHQPAGVYESRGRAAYWDGKNRLGEPVASGVYFYTLTAGDFTATRKLLIAK